jgi:cold shock protein
MPCIRNGEVLQRGSGFGFIQSDRVDMDVLVHATALQAVGIASLKEGDRVSFELEDDKRRRGKQAVDLKLA